MGKRYPARPISLSRATPVPASVAVGHQCRAGSAIRSLASGQESAAIARLPRTRARHGCLMMLWMRTGDDSEAWFSVEPAGLHCLYRNGPDTWR